MPSPTVIVLAGPNGAGKTTAAPRVLRDLARVHEFVNADTIAQGLAGFDVESAAISAGRIMLSRLHELAAERRDFAFESTLASRSFAPWLVELMGAGYEFHLVFLWLPSPEMAIARVAQRVRLGGHDIPEATIRRRYAAGLRNFFRLFQPIATSWRMYDNSKEREMTLLARGKGTRTSRIAVASVWNQILREFGR